VVKPAYGVMVTETFELRPNGVPAFKFGKAPAPARAGNYDDWNEPLGGRLSHDWGLERCSWCGCFWVEMQLVSHQGDPLVIEE
jgi:hypothetical protein